MLIILRITLHQEVPPVIDNEATTSQVEYPQPPAVDTSEISETENRTRRRNKVNKTLCQVCSKEHVGKSKSGKAKKTCNWLNCEVSSCSYRVHALCVGFLYQKDFDVKNVKYYCPVHIKTSPIELI
jgi:hypothetical protein